MSSSLIRLRLRSRINNDFFSSHSKGNNCRYCYTNTIYFNNFPRCAYLQRFTTRGKATESYKNACISIQIECNTIFFFFEFCYSDYLMCVACKCVNWLLFNVVGGKIKRETDTNRKLLNDGTLNRIKYVLIEFDFSFFCYEIKAKGLKSKYCSFHLPK